MSKSENIVLRSIVPSDVDTFHRQQLDPEAIWLAAFIGRDPADRAAFAVHWGKILASDRNTNRTIMAGGDIAGYICCYPQDEHLEVTYWLGREFWGRGAATEALRQMLRLVSTRPILARVATDNPGSLRVLQKCGFQITGTEHGFALGRGVDTEEYLLRLGQAPTGG